MDRAVRRTRGAGSIASLRELQPWLEPYAQALVQVAEYYGLGPVSINSVYRSIAKQSVLYDRYLEGKSDFPVAPPGTSLHQRRLAFDINVRDGSRSAAQSWLGAVWNSWGGRWSSVDPVHFTVST